MSYFSFTILHMRRSKFCFVITPECSQRLSSSMHQGQRRSHSAVICMFIPFMISAVLNCNRHNHHRLPYSSLHNFLYKIKNSFRCTFQYNLNSLLCTLPYMLQRRSCYMNLYSLLRMSSYNHLRSRSGWRVVLRAWLRRWLFLRG